MAEVDNDGNIQYKDADPKDAFNSAGHQREFWNSPAGRFVRDPGLPETEAHQPYPHDQVATMTPQEDAEFKKDVLDAIDRFRTAPTMPGQGGPKL